MEHNMHAKLSDLGAGEYSGLQTSETFQLTLQQHFILTGHRLPANASHQQPFVRLKSS